MIKTVTNSQRGADNQLLDRTIDVWQPRSKRLITSEDARQIVANCTGFFQILSEWRAAEVEADKKT